MNDAYKTSLSITTTGATAATGILECAVGRKRGGGVQLTGTFTGTVQFEETLDSGTTWIAKTVYPVGGGAGVTSASATGTWKFACGGSTNFRVRCSAFTSGPIVVDLTLTEGVDPFSEQGANGGAFSSTVTLTRTADTNAYLAGDVIGAATGSTAALTFANIGPSGGGEVFITTASLEVDIAAIPSGMTSFVLHLYSATPPSALGDNAPFDLPAGDRATYLQSVSLGSPVDLGSTLFVVAAQINQQITVPSGGSLFGYLVTTGAFTPASATVFKITLKSVAA